MFKSSKKKSIPPLPPCIGELPPQPPTINYGYPYKYWTSPYIDDYYQEETVGEGFFPKNNLDLDSEVYVVYTETAKQFKSMVKKYNIIDYKKHNYSDDMRYIVTRKE